MVCENYRRILCQVGLEIQLSLYEFTDGSYSLALALDVFVNVIAHYIYVIEEIGKG